ncbi:hypothetical protein IFR04_009673 [Cadophora malorum]|uniref:Uncharacterized protein n=1 Tax=Cadophora malorum TaxID=108018 RepID=A0A8H7WA52_9HELO|nr:hypothetical protein IFR04_009673 [Cadophora malorum]
MDVIKNSFIYEKLLDDDTQPVRVLKVFLSSDFEAAKECELIYTFLKGPNRVECEAVSYVWGNIVHDYKINIAEFLVRWADFDERPLELDDELQNDSLALLDSWAESLNTRDVARKSRDGAPLRDSPMSILDSSWGPSTTEAGDTKIVAAAALLRLFSERSTMGINLSVASGSSTPNLSSKKMRTTKEDSSSS